ncbi:Rieske 2Fe-2S domain-containing protein [Sphingomonas sp.]|uniref:Rieske 2Fe-2S domain-containing protein n=1 Tax=Sphingomonas sp. TaxID=28214 RepID=UPI002FC99E26
MSKAAFVDPALLKQVKVGRDYVAAKYGFRNHWYPALLSDELGEADPQTAQLCGERILLNRVDGVAYAIKDQCVHKGVPFSKKLECYSKGTVTCWYHGFTYRFSDGLLVGIVGMPHSNVIGRRHVKSYPVVERKGVIFVFVGDEGVEPAPLEHDVPPGFLDEGIVIRGRRQEVAANWRIGCENGFDSTHIFIHKDSRLIADGDLALPLGLVPTGQESYRVEEEEGGPKGVYDIFSPETVMPVFEGKIGDETVLMGAPHGKNMLPHTISMWLPCALRVDPWPAPHLTQFEWYVPIDGERHTYFQLIGTKASTAAEEQAFEREYREKWIPSALDGFNKDDVWAREASQAFYADDSGWIREQLFEADANIVKWRRLAAKHHRGLQTPQHIA